MRTTHMTINRFIEAEEIQKDGYRGHTLIHKGDFFITYRQEVTKDGEATYVIPKELFHALFEEIDPVKTWKHIAEFLNSPDEDTEKKWDPFKDTEIVKSVSPWTDAMRKAINADPSVSDMRDEILERLKDKPGTINFLGNDRVRVDPVTGNVGIGNVKYDSAGSGAIGVTEPKVKLEVRE